MTHTSGQRKEWLLQDLIESVTCLVSRFRKSGALTGNLGAPRLLRALCGRCSPWRTAHGICWWTFSKCRNTCWEESLRCHVWRRIFEWAHILMTSCEGGPSVRDDENICVERYKGVREWRRSHGTGTWVFVAVVLLHRSNLHFVRVRQQVQIQTHCFFP